MIRWPVPLLVYEWIEAVFGERFAATYYQPVRTWR